MVYGDMDLPTEILNAVKRIGFDELTEVQEKAIPPMLLGADIIAKAPTGTGKTCAFGIPLLINLDLERTVAQSLVLAPTRELAQQIATDLCDLAYYMPNVRIACLYGGQSIQKQFTQLNKKPQIIIATPGRLLDHINRRSLRIKDITCVILDEADEMLNMGFYKDVIRILDSMGNIQQLGMFSATISREVMDIGWMYQRDPVEITVQAVAESLPKIKQYSVLSTGQNKHNNISYILQKHDYHRVMIFCNEKYSTVMLSNQLRELNIDANYINGDLPQGERNNLMKKFKEGNLHVLVCTDVAARGIDVDDVDAVINYDIPTSNEYYIHRIGRTGRAKKYGDAYTLYLQDELRRLEELARLTHNSLVPISTT